MEKSKPISAVIIFLFIVAAIAAFPGIIQKAQAQDYDYGDAPDSSFAGYRYPTSEGQPEWVRRAGGIPNNFGRGIAVDSYGNTYIAGEFEGAMAFGSIVLVSAGVKDVYLAKYDSEGNVLWAKRIGGTNFARGAKIAVDSSDNVYITGYFEGTAVFDSISLTEAGSSDIFLAKYDSSGNVLWALSEGGSGIDHGNNIIVDSAGSIYITGCFSGTAIFGGASLTSAGGSDIFVAKYNTSGNLIWVKIAGGSNDDYGHGIAVDNSGNTYVTGEFYGSAAFDSTVLTASEDIDVFTVKYDNTGTLLWAQSAGGTGSDEGRSIGVDNSGNSYITGMFLESATFGPTTLTSAGNWDIFIAKYDTAGSMVWAKRAGGNSGDYGYGLSMDNNGHVFIVGGFSETATFDSITLTSVNMTDIYIAEYDSTGNVIQAKQAGSDDFDDGFDITVDDYGSIYIVGDFFQTTTFGQTTISSAGGFDTFVAKYVSPAKHFIDNVRYLGSCVDSETDGQPSDADEDDSNIGIVAAGTCSDPGDDEDGVIFDSPMQIGLTSNIEVEATVSGNLSAWLDFNADGDWKDQGEQIFADQVLTTGTNTLRFLVPLAAEEGYTYMRFRFSSDTGLSYHGEATNGEVEDYKVDLMRAFDYGDAPDPLSGSVEKYATVEGQLPGWAKNAGGTGIDNSYDITSDDLGNSYVTGNFYLDATFGPFTLTSGGSGDIFVAKYDNDGNVIWVQSAGGSENDTGRAVSVDSSGNVYVTGNFSGTATFGQTTLISSGDSDVFVIKYDNNGNLLWVQSGGGSSYDTGYEMALDSSGSVYVTGFFFGSAAFGLNPLTSAGQDDIFLAKYDTNGNFIWAISAGGTADDYGYAISVDDMGASYITGSFWGFSTFGPINLASTDSSDIFVAKYDSDGTFLWAKSAGGASEDHAYGINLDSLGNIYITGWFYAFARFDHILLTSEGMSDIFLAKYSNNGSLLWVKRAGGSSRDYSYGITVDNLGNSYITGYFEGITTFKLGEMLISNGMYDIFIAKYNSRGNAVWAQGSGGGGNDLGYGVGIDDPENIYVTGRFQDTASFGSTTLTANGGADIFVSSYRLPAKHLFDGITYLGDCVDSETDGQPEADSLGDDNNLGGTVGTCAVAWDDEDGVSFSPTLPIGLTSSLDVKASTTGNFSGWIDFNGDGDWEDQGEQVFVDENLSTGVNSLLIFTAEDTVEGETYMRFRFSSVPGLNYYGTAIDGEVEDYKVKFAYLYDYGDAPDSLSPGAYYTREDNQSPDWVQLGGGDNGDTGMDITADSEGNSYVIGTYQETSTFGPFSFTSEGGYDVVIAKYDKNGNLMWARSAGSTAYDYGYGISVDSSGNVYVIGHVAGTAAFDSLTFTPAGLSDVFVAKYDNNGNILWVKGAGGSDSDFGYGIKVDSSDNFYITGSFSGTSTFGAGEINETVLASSGGKDIFAARYDNDGNLLWAVNTGSSTDDEGYYLSVDSSDSVYVTGYFQGTFTFGANTLTSEGQDDIFAAKYDDNGNEIWAKSGGGIGDDHGEEISVDILGNVYLTGYFRDTSVFDAVTLSSEGSTDIFIVKYDSAGNLLWVLSEGGDSLDKGYGITADRFGDIYVVGSFRSSVTFGQTTVTSLGEYDIFVAKYNNDGVLTWVQTGASTGNNFGYGITSDKFGSHYITGGVVGTATFGSTTATAAAVADIFVAKYNQPAKHLLDNLTYLGGCVDREPDGQQNIDADGDDKSSGDFTTGTCNIPGDDEDGVVFNSPMPIGLNSYIDVEASGGGNLSTWIDFNADGDWDDQDEKIFADLPLVSGINPLNFSVPEDAVEGDTYMRSRFSSDTGLTYQGPALDGEVEDYVVTIIQPELAINLVPPAITEKGLSSTATGFVTRNSGTIGALEVALVSSDTTEATVQPNVTILDGAVTAIFTITGVDDSLADGTKIVNITASATGFTSGNANLYVLDEDSRELSVSVDPVSISENGGISSGVVSRNTEDNTLPLTVNLSSDDTGEVTLPANIEIPVGQSSTTFTLTGIDDSFADGTQTVTITASSNGFSDGLGTIDITDDEPVPVLSITSIINSAAEEFQLEYEIELDQVAEYNTVVDYTIFGNGLHLADGNDFASGATGQKIITAGTLNTPIILDILADGVEEFEEGLIVTLSVNPSTMGSITSGTVSAGGTILNLPTEKSAGAIPGDTETGVSATAKISWMPGVDHENDSQTYDLYLGTDTVPIDQLAAGLSDNFYQLTLLGYNTTYYWRVDITDYAGNFTTGDVWSFTTQTSAESECPGVICNPSFEFGTAHWTEFGDTNMSVSSDAYDGLNSLSSEQLKTITDNPRWAGFSQMISGFSAGETYNLQLQAKGTDITQGHVKIKWYDSTPSLIETTYPLTGIEGTLTEWAWFNRVFTVPNTAETAEFVVWHGIDVNTQNVEGSTLIIDKIIWKDATDFCGTICNENFEAGLLFWTEQGKEGSHIVETTGSKDEIKSIRSEQLYTAGDPLQWTGIRQEIEVVENRPYNFRIWFKGENTVNGHVRIAWKDVQGNIIDTIFPVSGLTGTNPTWFKRESVVTPPANTTKALIVILHGVEGGETNSEGSTLWVDNITMIGDTLRNGGFEDGMNEWNINGYRDVTLETADVQEGINAVRLVQEATNAENVQWSGVSQRIKVTGGNTYQASLWLKMQIAVQGHVKVTWRDSDDNLISNSFPVTGMEGTDLNWVQKQSQITAPVNADTAEIFIWHGVRAGSINMTASRMWVDGVTFN